MMKRLKIALITLLLPASLALSFGAGCAVSSINPSSTDPGLEVVEEAWQIIFEEYVEKDRLDAGALSQAAIKGMIEELDDPYTSYLDPQTYHLSRENLTGKFEGIGAYVGIEDEKLTIINPMPGLPAAEAGIRAGDVILEIDGLPTLEMSLEVAILHIRGPRGTPVRLLALHQGETEPEEIEIIRAEIEISSVYFEMRDDIAYINIVHFTGRTNEELSPVLEDMTRQEATAIILDLRRNPGGLLDEVVDVASHFVKEGVVVQVVDNQGKQTSSPVTSQDITTDLPMVVLTDNFSASGSEVLAGALQDYGRATIAGTTTFGKGSVNTLRQLKDGSALYITTARWLTPKGRPIEGKGIVPDYELELEGEEAIQWAINYLKGVGGG
ncbi:MAG: S41 family peptidase [Dehalococcoidales bacterium]|nr:S41 family peptidase [Dehalococcoidales bacterium]